jgi:hypothetical protein
MAKRNRAFVKYRQNGQIVPGAMIITNDGNYPKGGPYKEVPMNLTNDTNTCPTPDYGSWKVVTGGVAGDGIVLRVDTDPDTFTFVGPNDDYSDGWVYLKQFFPEEKLVYIDYSWTSFDDGSGGPPSVDWPVYWTSSTEPTGIPGDLTVRAENTPETAAWSILVPAGQWFSVGLYSTDSCCGRGFLQTQITISDPIYLYRITTLPADNADATGNTSYPAVLGPNGHEYGPTNGEVIAVGSNGGASSSSTINNYAICSSYIPYVFYFKNNAYVIIDRPGTIVDTGTFC